MYFRNVRMILRWTQRALLTETVLTLPVQNNSVSYSPLELKIVVEANKITAAMR
jgi:hypothetical protein